MALPAAHDDSEEQKNGEGGSSLSVDNTGSTTKVPNSQVRGKKKRPTSSSSHGRPSALTASSVNGPSRRAAGGTKRVSAGATAASRLPCDDTQSSAPTLRHAGSGTVGSAVPAGESPVCPENESLLGPFVGKYDVEGSRSDPEEVVANANHLQDHESWIDDIILAFFVDATYDEETDTGAYSVVFKNFAPDDDDDGKIITMGWPLNPAIDNNVGEILAVAQATVLAEETLRRWWNRAQITHARSASALRRIASRPALACIFSDNTTTPLFIANPRGRPALAKDSLRFQIYKRMFEASRELAAIPGLETQLELNWLPSHMVGLEVRMHKQADRHSARVRREGRPICLVDGKEVPLSMEEGLVGDMELRETFQRRGVEARRKREFKRLRRERKRSYGRLSFGDQGADEGEEPPAKRRKGGGGM